MRGIVDGTMDGRLYPRKKAAAGFLAALCLQACLMQTEKAPLVVPDADTEDAAEEAPVAGIEEVCRASFDVLCIFFNTCCTPDERSNPYIFDLVISVGFACEAPGASALYRDCVQDAVAAVSAGTLTVNAPAVAPCTSALYTFSPPPMCQNAGVFLANYYGILDEHCRYVWQGLAAENETCMIEEECAAGLYCDGSGRCIPVIPDGGMCSEDRQCGQDMACLFGGFCGEPLGVGQECGDDADCALPLFCNLDSGVCSGLLDEGADCREGFPGCRGLCREGVCVDACR